MLTLAQVNDDPFILQFIKSSGIVLKYQGYTDHGLDHSQLVADRARTLAQAIGLSKREQELAAISGFCHDMGNFLSRSHHHYFGALLFYQAVMNNPQISSRLTPQLIKDISIVMQAIANHDKHEMKFSHPVAAVLVIADKSDVRRSRVLIKDIKEIKKDIHDRVNYATTFSKLKTDKRKKVITLTLKIDTNFVPVMEYFEIFTSRMVYCREAAEFLGYKFALTINNFKLL